VAGEVTVNRAAMVTAAQQVENALGEIRAQQTRLAGYHDELASSWKGVASTAFTNAYNQFNADFTIVINALQAIHEKLVGSHTNYNAVENANTSTMNKIASALNR
jgi:WXG100 family type VII secretion target